MSRSVDCVIITRFNLPSAGVESLIRAEENWLRNRVELFERYCVPSVVAQTSRRFTWLIYFDPQSPDWLLERLRPHVDAGTFVAKYRESVAPADLVADLAEVVPVPHADDVITVNLDNDDALAVDFVARLRDVATPDGSAAIFFEHGLIRSGGRVYLRRDTRNAFRAVRDPWTKPLTCWFDWHNMLDRHMPAVEVAGPPAWLQVVHGQNVSNRVRGRLVAASAYRSRFAPGALDDVVDPRPGELARDRLIDRPGRSAKDAARSGVKRVALRVLGKRGFDEAKHRWASLRRVAFRRGRSVPGPQRARPAVIDELVIVVVTYNSAGVVGEMLDSIPAALGPVRAEVVVVDNGSDDGTAELVAARDDCQLVRAENRGYAAGINRGVAAASGRGPILALNPDLRLHPQSIANLVAALASGAGAIIAPQVRNADGSLHHSLRREPSIPRTLGLNFTGRAVFAEYVNDDRDYAEPRVVDWALGAALLMSRECYDALGGWDESFFLYSEETEFCLRARDEGWLTTYEPSAVVTHIGGQSGQSGRTHSMQMINRIRLYRRRHSALASWAFFLLTALREASWITRRGELTRPALRAMFRPSTRPPELGCSDRLLPH